MLRAERQSKPAAEARAVRIWLGFVYVLATILAATFVGAVIIGIVTHRGSLIAAGLFMCCSFALFWRDIGRRICRDLRHRRDRATTRNANDKTRNA
jgi:hypothetical protein